LSQECIQKEEKVEVKALILNKTECFKVTAEGVKIEAKPHIKKQCLQIIPEESNVDSVKGPIEEHCIEAIAETV